MLWNPDRPFHNFRTLRSGDRRILFSKRKNVARRIWKLPNFEKVRRGCKSNLPYNSCRAPTSGDWPILCDWGTSRDRFLSSAIAKRSVGTRSSIGNFEMRIFFYDQDISSIKDIYFFLPKNCKCLVGSVNLQLAAMTAWIVIADVLNDSLTNRTFRRFRAWKSIHRRILRSSEASIVEFSWHKTAKYLVRICPSLL